MGEEEPNVVPDANPLKLGAAFPNEALETTAGPIKLAEWLCADPAMPWTIFFSHPADFTPVCTTELGMCHNLAGDFAAMGAKLIGVSCDSVESHNAWAKDVVAKAGAPDADLAFPIIADPDRKLVTFFGMIDPEEGNPPMPARALVILYGNVVKLTLLYPATTGRDFDEIKRVLRSLQLTQNNGLATPVNWVPGDPVVVTPGFEGKNDGKKPDTIAGFETAALPSGKAYLRTIPGAYVEGLPPAAPAAGLEVQPGSAAGSNPLSLGKTFPNDAFETTTGPIKLAEWLEGDAEKPWTIFFSHPADFTPVCTTELGMCHNLAGDFAAMGAKLIGVSCDSVESHNAWAKDVVAKAGTPDADLAFPIIADPDRKLVTFFGMIDPEEGNPPMPARALVILQGSAVKLTIVYPATTGRNFEEIKRVLRSLQLTANNGLATPVNWKEGDRVVVTPAFEGKNDGKKPDTIEGYEVADLPSGKPYLRTIPCPQ